jgi:hypothetical protein
VERLHPPALQAAADPVNDAAQTHDLSRHTRHASPKRESRAGACGVCAGHVRDRRGGV